MEQIVVTIIIAALGSSGLSSILLHYIEKRDKKKQGYENLESELRQVKVDNCRTQMLMLMSMYPDETAEIMKLAKRYFVDLDGDFYMTSLFIKWLHSKDLELPIWWQPKIENFLKGE